MEDGSVDVVEAPDAGVQEPVAESAPPIVDNVGQEGQEGQQEEKPNPLEPGGDRFKQVWARAKSAESQIETLRSELQREREERIRYEERAKVREEAKPAQPEYTWAQFRAAIDAGQISEADAMTAWGRQEREKAKREVVQELEGRLATQTKQVTVSDSLKKYQELDPEIKQIGSEKRNRLEAEYSYLLSLGYTPGPATELVAIRSVMGPIEQLERAKQAQTKTAANREPYMETQSSTKPKVDKKDPVANLTADQKTWYESKIKAGMYAGWDEVRSELTWTRGKK